MSRKYGHFSKDGREYIITRPDTPRPWINYLTNGLYCALVSQTGGGYSFVEEAGYNRITRERPGDILLEDRPGRYIYIRDQQKGKFWSVNWQPVCQPLDSWEGYHGLGYTRINSSQFGIASELTFFVPREGTHEVWFLKLRNQTSQTRALSLFSFVEWCLGSYIHDLLDRSFNSFFNVTWFSQNAVFATKKRWERPDTKELAWGKIAFIACNEEVKGFDGFRESFLGRYHSLSSPQVLEAGRCRNSQGEGQETVGVLQKDLTLGPREGKQLAFIIGVVKNQEDFQRVARRYQKIETALVELKDVCQFWEDYLSRTWVVTPDGDFNLSVNVWNKYQCWVTSAFSEMDSFYIGGGGTFGFRDECQHVMGVLPQNPALVKEKIVLLLEHQFSDGKVAHNWRVVDDKAVVTEHSDDAQWLVMAILNYLKETGDLRFLKEGLKFYDRGKATVFEHLAKAMDYTLSNLSPRGLCLHRTADWNDALAGGRLGRGESMMVSNMTCWNIKELLPLLKKLSQKKLVQKYQMVYEKMKMVLNKECWDGEWYIRATDDDRTTLGSNKRKEGRIFLDAQTWSVISSVADSERGKQAMDAARDHLDTPYGPVIFLPSFTHLNSALGIISQFVPGTKENGAIFHHLVTWAVIAECLLGRGNQAFSYWQKTNFITRGKNPDLYKTEPYVYSEFVFGPESQFFGEGSFSWITGSAAWFYRACLDWILGVRPTLDGLLIDPCIPKEWKSFEVKRTFRGAVYQIKVKNPEYVSKGIKQIKVDGQKISGQILPVLKKGKCQVEVEMG